MAGKPRPITDAERKLVVETYRELGAIMPTRLVVHMRDARIKRILDEAGIDYSRPRRFPLRPGEKPGLGRQPEPHEWAYLAGCFDVGGTSRADPGDHDILVINANSTSQAQAMRAMVGAGKVHTRKRGYTAEFRLYRSVDIIEFISGIAPYVVAKRSLITRVAIDVQDYLPSYRATARAQPQPHDNASVSW